MPQAVLARGRLETFGRRDFLEGATLVDDGCWIAGERRNSVLDPATGEEFARVARCGAADMKARHLRAPWKTAPSAP